MRRHYLVEIRSFGSHCYERPVAERHCSIGIGGGGVLERPHGTRFDGLQHSSRLLITGQFYLDAGRTSSIRRVFPGRREGFKVLVVSGRRS